MSSGVFAFLPYVTLHMKQIGLTNEEVALTYAILPVSSILGPLIGGMVADKLGAFKAVFLCNAICMAVLHTLFVTVPYAPNAPELSFSCNGGEAKIGWSSTSCPLPPSVSSLAYQQMNLTLKNCKYECRGDEEFDSSYTMCLMNGNQRQCFQRDATSKVQLVVDTGSLHSTSTQPIDDLEQSSFFCNDELRPRIKNVSFEDNQYDGLSCLDHCDLRCDVNGGTQYHNFQVPQYSTTFWVYLALRIPAQFFLASAMTMMDALTMAVIENRGGDFGKQRLMSMLSLASMPFISSAIVHNAPTDNGSPDYTIAFYFGDVLLVIAVIVTAYIDLERPETPSRNVLKDLRQLLTTLDIVVFLAVILVLGSNWGFLESFFFVYLSELKAPAYMLVLASSACIQCSHPVLASSARIQCSHPVLASSARIQCSHPVLASSARIQCSHSFTLNTINLAIKNVAASQN
ncbi:Major facilitator superfamily associated domain [Trinorchestia longiramus]|nr:Major facilitator superfamily associated domain [Trinorchestia longiramus]